MILYHATTSSFERFEKQKGQDAGFHFGSEAQARMRGGSQAHLLKVKLDVSRLKRMKDKGQWTPDQIRRAANGGYDGIIYLNRYEGMTTARIEDLLRLGKLDKLDGLSDAAFKKLVPEAEDSVIVFSPEQISILEVEAAQVDKEEAPALGLGGP